MIYIYQTINLSIYNVMNIILWPSLFFLFFDIARFCCIRFNPQLHIIDIDIDVDVVLIHTYILPTTYSLLPLLLSIFGSSHLKQTYPRSRDIIIHLLQAFVIVRNPTTEGNLQRSTNFFQLTKYREAWPNRITVVDSNHWGHNINATTTELRWPPNQSSEVLARASQAMATLLRDLPS